MNIKIQMQFREGSVLLLLSALALHNKELLLKDPSLPLLYDSCVVYKREEDETFSDYLAMLKQGWEDCDSLAAARAGELMARGHLALRAGEAGYREAARLKLKSIPAQVMLTTRTREGEAGLFHVITRYWVGAKEYRDDPSARLGMVERRVDPNIVRKCHLINLNSESWRTV